MLYLGLEDDEAVQEVEGSRRRVYHRDVAPPRAQPPTHRRLGRTYQVLGLNDKNRILAAVLFYYPYQTTNHK